MEPIDYMRAVKLYASNEARRLWWHAVEAYRAGKLRRAVWYARQADTIQAVSEALHSADHSGSAHNAGCAINGMALRCVQRARVSHRTMVAMVAETSDHYTRHGIGAPTLNGAHPAYAYAV